MATTFNPRPCPCGCKKWIMAPWFGCQCSSLSTEEKDELMTMARDAARYRWLRNGNGYAPEENHAHGYEKLDRLCDAGIEGKEINFHAP